MRNQKIILIIMINNMDILWIDEIYIKKYAPIMKNVDMVFINPHIIEAQNIQLHSLIGGYLYDTIYNEYKANSESGTTISEKYTTLVNNYLKPIILYYTVADSIDDLYSKITNKGIEIQSSENSESISEKEKEKRRTFYINKAESYAERCLDFLKYNDTTYIRWRDDDPSNPYQVKSEKNTAYRGNLIIGKRNRNSSCYTRQNLNKL